jgi:hypothetical protein
MWIWDRIKAIIGNVKALLAILGWLGLSAWVGGIATAAGGAVWAVMTHVSTPLVIMAVFCTFTGAVYLGLAPMAYRALARIQDAPTRPIRPDPEIWRHLSTLRLYEAACLLADIEPNKSKVDEPGDVNGWYRALYDAIRDNEILYIYSILDDDRTTQYGYLPHPDTVITREDLRKFSTSRNLKRAFLS